MIDRPQDFIEAIARGFEVIIALDAPGAALSLAEVAAATELSRPTARRILITLAELGYVRSDRGRFSLTPRVLELGAAYTRSANYWELARGRLSDLVRGTSESSSIAVLDGADILYVARVAAPRLVDISVGPGTRFLARSTALGKVLLAALSPAELQAALVAPSAARTAVPPPLDEQALHDELREVRARGWAAADQELAPVICSIAVPLRNGSGQCVAAMNLSTNPFEVPLEQLVATRLPALIAAGGEISHDLALWELGAAETVPPAQS